MHAYKGVRRTRGGGYLQRWLNHYGYFVCRDCLVAACCLGHYVELGAYKMAGYGQLGVECANATHRAVRQPLNVMCRELNTQPVSHVSGEALTMHWQRAAGNHLRL